MSRNLLSVLTVLLLSPAALAQRDAPVWHSYLPSIQLYDERTTTDFDLVYCKAGGPHEHTEQQMYVLAYLEKDEPKILELAADKKLTNKKEQKAKLLLDVFEEQKLVAVLDTKLARVEELRDEPEAKGKRLLPGKSFKFSFSFENAALFKTVKQLKNFDQENVTESDARYYNDKFKLLIFVPANDCKYATLVAPKLRDMYDFAHFYDMETILLYFKPLPYRFQFKPLEDGTVVIYKD